MLDADVHLSGGETGPFRAIEESTLAHLTDQRARSDVYAWYNVSGTIGSAFGLVICGWAIHYLHTNLGWQLIDGYRAIFCGYALVGLAKVFLVSVLSNSVELSGPEKVEAQSRGAGNTAESTPLLGEETPEEELNPVSIKSGKGPMLPTISQESVRVISTLCLLFALDSFATGLAPL